MVTITLGVEQKQLKKCIQKYKNMFIVNVNKKQAVCLTEVYDKRNNKVIFRMDWMRKMLTCKN